ncbi:MAG TPA: hypothetical protein RMH85_16200 [Polyangiaceae bacterium LLY-WYZ-15_(1-7)]|nr:hypothetical protein [Myxococcales bacterium]MAT29805.1 hypothetical protein [Sandaracinus sp.]HJL01193.1 hypothetical protein [Polyangiaceae bacterium LLY-WYZ-15_(1-7)]MBJ71104.1 hypothetical protein [Sandaracinus sp.]HJL10044.1 hypothetical protein [Polyangiaceae bacterium LLY-WYZ-15_(1-7)]
MHSNHRRIRAVARGLACALALVALPRVAAAQSAEATLSVEADAESPAPDRTRWSQRHAFERDFALGLYATGWAGRYLGAGAGARARWEPFDRLGVEVFAEGLKVENPDGLRHDHPVGFNLYVPWRVSENVRLRPLFGFCAVFSFLHPEQDGLDRVDDVHFGIHGGAGVEVALGRFVSLFLDVQGVLYFGHDRYAGGWDVHLEDQVSAWGLVQGAAGVQVHL